MKSSIQKQYLQTHHFAFVKDSLLLLGFCFTALFCQYMFAFSLHAEESQQLNFEVEVVPQASLQIMGSGPLSQSQGGVRIDLGPMDAFGQRRSPGVIVKKTPTGAAYLYPIKIVTGVSGMMGAVPQLQVQLLPGLDSLRKVEVIEAGGQARVPEENLNALRQASPKIVGSRLNGRQEIERFIGFHIEPTTPNGKVSAQILYSLELGL